MSQDVNESPCSSDLSYEKYIITEGKKIGR